MAAGDIRQRIWSHQLLSRHANYIFYFVNYITFTVGLLINSLKFTVYWVLLQWPLYLAEHDILNKFDSNLILSNFGFHNLCACLGSGNIKPGKCQEHSGKSYTRFSHVYQLINGGYQNHD